MNISILNEILDPDHLAYSHPLERVGDRLVSPARSLFGIGKTYTVEKLNDESIILKNHEKFSSPLKQIAKVFAAAILPFSLAVLLIGVIGLSLKSFAVKGKSTEKYSFPILINARTEENFAGKLPPNPLSPNCVNSQQKSLWGALYNVEPIKVPQGVENPMERMKATLQGEAVPNFNPANLQIVEQRSNYLHCVYTVTISTGPFKGIYIDDLDLYFDEEKRQFDVRSASRTGFRDAVHLDFAVPGANKKRIEAIRLAFA